MIKPLHAFLAMLLPISLSACASTDASTTPTSTPSSDSSVSVGMIQYMEHGSLDAASEGFIDGLADQGYVEGENLSLIQNNAQGDASNADAIVSRFVNDNVDLIFANATPAAQTAAAKTMDIPIIITSVTDPAESGLVQSNENPGVNISGTSDMADIETQIDLVTQLLPDVSTIGIMYCSAEANSQIQAELAKTTIESLGLSWKEYTVSDSTYIQSTVQSAIGNIDVLFVPTDNLMAESIAAITGVANQSGLPVITGFGDAVEQGALASYGVDYYQVGYLAGTMAAKVLNGQTIETMPIGYLEEEDYELMINTTVLNDLGLTIPETLANSAILYEGE